MFRFLSVYTCYLCYLHIHLPIPYAIDCCSTSIWFLSDTSVSFDLMKFVLDRGINEYTYAVRVNIRDQILKSSMSFLFVCLTRTHKVQTNHTLHSGNLQTNFKLNLNLTKKKKRKKNLAMKICKEPKNNSPFIHCIHSTDFCKWSFHFLNEFSRLEVIWMAEIKCSKFLGAPSRTRPANWIHSLDI